MIRDRGNIKWTAMMLTEHVKEIRDWYDSDNDIPEPDQCDEDRLNSFADELNIAYRAKSDVRILYWINKQSKIYEGQIVKLLPNEQAVKIRSNEIDSKIKLKHILKVDIYD